MKVRVIAQEGIKFTEEVDYVVLETKNGQMAILERHVPVITSVDQSGFFKLVSKNFQSFIVVDRASVVFKENTLDIFALHAQIGTSLEKARAAYGREMKAHDENSKKENIDFSRQERELRENIMKAKAGHL